MMFIETLDVCRLFSCCSLHDGESSWHGNASHSHSHFCTPASFAHPLSLCTQRGFSPIHSAAYNSHKEAIKLLLDRKSCEVDYRSRYNETPLHIACLRGHLEVVQYLVAKEADLGARDDHRNTVLHYASSSNSASLMHWLLGRGVVREQVKEKNKVGMCTQLTLGAGEGYV